jgi:glutamine amidotransferase
MKIAIIDYGLGNLRSVIRGLEKAGAQAVITCDAADIASDDGLVLPVVVWYVSHRLGHVM